jgi:glycosyltransferase involved in cell wall biosynthesis
MSRIHAKKNVAALVRAYARVRSEQNKEIFGHSRSEAETAEGKLTQPTDRETALRKIDEDGSERLAADRPGENAAGPVTRAGDGQSQQNGKGHGAFPDLVIAGPGWESDYGREVCGLIDVANSNFAQSSSTLDLKLKTSHSAPLHAVGMLSGAAKWGALYGCEAFVLPSHQENFGIAVVEALACGKPVLISDQVNIWREIVEDRAGLVEGDTEEGVEKLLRKFFDGWRGGPSEVVSPSRAERAEASGRSAFAPSDSLLHSATAAQDGVTRGGPRECYLKRFAIGPAAVKLAAALKGAGVASDW